MKCSKQLSSGLECGAEALSDSVYCLMHDERPVSVQKHREMSRRGGQNKLAAKPVDIAVDLGSAHGILDTAQKVGQALLQGKVDRSRANALSYILATAIQARKVLDYEERLRRIERRLDLRKQPEA